MPPKKTPQLLVSCFQHPNSYQPRSSRHPSSYSVPSCCRASCSFLLQDLLICLTSAEETPTCWVEVLKIPEITLLQSSGWSQQESFVSIALQLPLNNESAKSLIGYFCSCAWIKRLIWIIHYIKTNCNPHTGVSDCYSNTNTAFT